MADEKRPSWNVAVQRAGARRAPPQDIIGDSRWWTPESQQQRRANRTQGFSVRSPDPLREAAGVRRPQIQVPRRGTPEYDAMIAEQQIRESDALRAARVADDAAARAQGPYGIGMSYLDPNTPNIYRPLSEAATAVMEMPDYLRSLSGDPEAARRMAGQPARALDLSRDLRSVGEAFIGPEDALGMADRLGTGEGDWLDYALAPLTVAPGPVGRGFKRFAADPLRRGLHRLEAGLDRVRGIAPSAAARTTARDMSPPPSVNVGLVVEPDMSGTGRRELLSPDEARRQLSNLGVNIRRDQVRASMTEPTLVAELDRALTPEEAFAASEGLRQKAIAHVGPEGGALSGPLAEDWGTFSDEYYMPFAETYDNAPLVTDPFSARLVSEAEITRRLLRERALAEKQMVPVEGLSAGLNALNARNAEPYLAQLPSEEALLRRLSGLGINTDTMDADWARSLAVERLRDAPANPTSALGVHYSRIPDLTQTDPSFYGTGHQGQDYGPTRARGGANRTHFYISRDGRPVEPEEAVERIAPYRYEADLEGMYDLDADPDMLVALARARQGRDIITGAGYKPTIPGYMSQGQRLESGSAIPDVERLLQQYGYGGFLADFGSQRAAGMYEPVNVRRTP